MNPGVPSKESPLPPRPRGRRSGNGGGTRDALLIAAEKIFAEIGFSTARLDYVADAVGIRRASLLYYFPTKQELYDEVEAGIFRDLAAHTERRLQGCETPWEQLHSVIDAWIDFWIGRPTGARIILRITADITPRINNPIQFAGPTIFHFERILRSGVERGTFSDCAASDLICILGGSILHYICIAPHLGETHSYCPTDPVRLAAFRTLVHRAAQALLSPGEQ